MEETPEYDASAVATPTPLVAGQTGAEDASNEQNEPLVVEQGSQFPAAETTPPADSPVQHSETVVANTAAQVAQPDHSGSVEQPTHALSNFIVEPTPEVENGEQASVAAFLGVSADVLSGNPELLKALVDKFSAFENLKTDNEILSLNYERLQHQTKKRMETATEQLKAVQASFNELKQTNSDLEVRKKQLEDSLMAATKAKSQEDNVAVELRTKITMLNTQNQSNCQILESKQQEILNLTEEIKVIAQDNKDLRKRMMDSETALEETKSQWWSTKSEVSKYERELKSVKETSSWYETELKSKSSQLAKLKGSSEGKIVALESELIQLRHDYNVAKTTGENYSKNLSDLAVKNEKHSFQVKELTDKLAIQESQFMDKLNKRDELIQVLETANRDKSARIESLETLYNETLEKVKNDEKEYKMFNDKLFKELAVKDLKLEELEKMVDQLSESATLDHSGEHISLNASSQQTLKELNTYSLTDLIGEINSLRREVIKEKRAKVKAEEELETIFAELDKRMPVLQSYKEKCDDYEEKQHKMTVILDSLTKENASSSKQIAIANKRVGELQTQCNTLAKYKVDLQHQVVVLLSELQFKCNGELPLTNDEKHYINSIVTSYGDITDVDTTDTDALISSRLTTFKDVLELVKQNEQLLTVSRKLGEELEQKNPSDSLENSDNETIIKAKSAIVKLQTQLKNTETQLEAVTHSKDVLQDLVDSQGISANKADMDALNERVNTLAGELQKKKDDMEAVRTKYDNKIISLNDTVQRLSTEKADVTLQWNKEKSCNTLLQEKVSYSETLTKNLTAEKSQLLENASKLQDRLRYFEDKLLASNGSIVKNSTIMAELEITIKGLTAEKQILKNTEAQLRQDIEKLRQEKIESNTLIVKLETINSERQAHFKETLQRYMNNINVCQKEIDQLRAKLDASYNETHSILHSKNADSKAYQGRIDLLQSQIVSLNESVTSKTKQVEELTVKLDVLTKRYNDIEGKKQMRLNTITGSSGANDEVTALKAELADAIEDLELVTRDATQYKELSIATEKQLTSLNEVFAKYKTSSETKAADLTNEVEKLTTTVKDLEAARDSLKSQLENLRYDTNIQQQESQLKITELNSTIAGFEAIKKDYEEKIEIIKKDADFNSDRVVDLQNELSGKTEQLDGLESVKRSIETQLETVNQSLVNITSELSTSKAYHESELSKWESERKRYEEESRGFKIRISELDTQNRTLINQFEASPLSMGDSGDMKTLVTYLTREKDSLTQQLEYSKNEEKVLRQEVANKDQELSLLQAELTSAKERVVVLDKYSAKLEDLKSEVSEMAVYKDNNNQLRDQITSLEKTIADAKSQYAGALEQLQQKNQSLTEDIAKRDQVLSQANAEVERLKSQVSSIEVNEGDKTQQLTSKVKELSELSDKFEKMKNLSRERYKKLKDEYMALEAEKGKLAEQIKNLSGQAESNEELTKLRIQMRTLRNQLHEKEVEKGELVAKHANETQALTQELEKIKAHGTPDDLRAEFEKEKAEALKNLENQLRSSTPNGNEAVDRSKLDEEWKRKLAVEIEAAKAQQLSKASKILERRKQEFKDKEGEYESKIAALEEKLKAAPVPNQNDTSQLVAKFEAEKAEYMKQCEEEKEKLLREKVLKETLMQKKVDVYEKKLKDLESGQAPATQSAVAGAPSATSAFGMPILGTSTPVASAFNFNSAAKSAPTFKFNPGSLPTQPAKRARENEEAESKRSKLE